MGLCIGLLSGVNDNKSYLFGLVFYLDNEVKYCFQNFQVIHINNAGLVSASVSVYWNFIALFKKRLF